MDHVQSFQTALEGLRGCVPPDLSRVYLPRENYSRLACIPDESLTTKSACVKEARGRLEELYGAAVKQMERCQDPHSATSLLAAFRASLNRRLSGLRTTLGSCRTPATAAVVNRIMALLDGTVVLEAMTAANEDLRRCYALPLVGHFADKITYDVCDPGEFEEGLGKVIAAFFVRHGYNLLPAIQALENEASELLEGYHDAFCVRAQAEIDRTILAPVEAKLPLLWEAMERGCPA